VFVCQPGRGQPGFLDLGGHLLRLDPGMQLGLVSRLPCHAELAVGGLLASPFAKHLQGSPKVWGKTISRQTCAHENTVADRTRLCPTESPYYSIARTEDKKHRIAWGRSRNPSKTSIANLVGFIVFVVPNGSPLATKRAYGAVGLTS
jgi:hypothetical protein